MPTISTMSIMWTMWTRSTMSKCQQCQHCQQCQQCQQWKQCQQFSDFFSFWREIPLSLFQIASLFDLVIATFCSWKICVANLLRLFRFMGSSSYEFVEILLYSFFCCFLITRLPFRTPKCILPECNLSNLSGSPSKLPSLPQSQFHLILFFFLYTIILLLLLLLIIMIMIIFIMTINTTNMMYLKPLCSLNGAYNTSHLWGKLLLVRCLWPNLLLNHLWKWKLLVS